MFSHHNAQLFLRKRCTFSRKKNISFDFEEKLKEKHAHFVGKNKRQFFKKTKKYKTFKSTQKLDLYVKKSGDFFESAPPPSIYHFDSEKPVILTIFKY